MHSGNSTTSSDVNITKDTVAPTIALVTPADSFFNWKSQMTQRLTL